MINTALVFDIFILFSNFYTAVLNFMIPNGRALELTNFDFIGEAPYATLPLVFSECFCVLNNSW